MILACFYGCLRFLVDMFMLKIDRGDREIELLLLRHELSVLRRTVRLWGAKIMSNSVPRLGLSA